MKPFKGLLKEMGMSLTEVMVGGAVLAGVGLGAASMFKNQNVAQKLLEHESNLLVYHQKLVKVFTSVPNCNATFQFAGYATQTYIDDVNAIKLCATNCDASFDASAVTSTSSFGMAPYYAEEGSFIDNKEIWMVDQITVPRIGPVVDSTVPVRMRVSYKLNPKIPNPKTVVKEIMFNVRFDDTGTFAECVATDGAIVDNLQREMCKGMTGVDSNGQGFNFFDETDQTCKPRSFCRNAGEELAGVDSNGNIVCRKIIDQNFVPNVDPTGVACGGLGSVLEYVAGKLRIRCL